MTRRRFDAAEYWSRMESGILAWDQPELPPGLSQFKNACIVAESLLSSPLNLETLKEQISERYPLTWALSQRVVGAIRLIDLLLLSSWRRGIIDLIDLADEAAATEQGDSPRFKEVLAISPYKHRCPAHETRKKAATVRPSVHAHDPE